MRRFAALLVILFVPSLAVGKKDSAEDAYQQARRGYYALKDDAKRRKFRHHWLNVVDRFQAVAKKYPKSTRAPDALFTSGELLNDLSRISMLDEDVKSAVETYSKLLDAFPKHRLADDSALAMARILLDRSDEPDRARRVLAQALKQTPRGDRIPEIRLLLSRIPAKPAPAATPKPYVRKTPPAVAQREEKAPEPKVALATEPEKAPEKAPEPKDDAGPSSSSREELAAAFARAATPPGEANAEAREDAKPADATKTAAADEKKDASETKVASAEQPSKDSVRPAAPAKRLKEAVKHEADPHTTLAQQLGLKVRRVVIDAGHGGHDSGAVGPKGTLEKDVALEISTRLAEILTGQGLEVILTRDDDRYLKLEDRVRFANEAKGDLFISVHCNASTNRRSRGIETYTLNIASDRYSIRLAARENASSEKGMSDLQFILADLATKANTEESTRLAKRVQHSLVSNLSSDYKGIRDLGTKQALFLVLLGAKMPAILVETSFISHPQEEKRLASKAYQQHVAEAIADGVLEFLGNRQKVAAKVD